MDQSIESSAVNKKLHTVIEDTNNTVTNTHVYREGDPLTVPDLVVILIALNPVYAEHLTILQSGTLSELTSNLRASYW